MTPINLIKDWLGVIIYVEENISVGGIKQFIQIREKEKNNPVIIVVYGWPGDD